MRITNSEILILKPNEIFGFGSNEAGIHGAGAAKLAFNEFGAEWGIGYGHKGQSFAIPTKDFYIQTLALFEIGAYVNKYVQYAKEHPELIFLTTEIGCGLAGYTPKDIAPLFVDAIHINNIHLPERFWEILNIQ